MPLQYFLVDERPCSRSWTVFLRPATFTDGSQYVALMLKVPETSVVGSVDALKDWRYSYITPGAVELGYGGNTVLLAFAVMESVISLQTGSEQAVLDLKWMLDIGERCPKAPAEIARTMIEVFIAN